jgi:hypothetical protein
MQKKAVMVCLNMPWCNDIQWALSEAEIIPFGIRRLSPSPSGIAYRLVLGGGGGIAQSIPLTPFSDLLRVPAKFEITPDSSTKVIWLKQRHLVFKHIVDEICPWILPTKYLRNTPEGSLACKILRHVADGFNSPLKEVVLRIFIAIKNPLFSTGF